MFIRDLGDNPRIDPNLGRRLVGLAEEVLSRLEPIKQHLR